VPRTLAFLIALTLAAVAAAQDPWPRRGRFPREPSVRFATESSFDGAFNFCRLHYTSARRFPSGQGWWTDYPDADNNFSIRLAELTKTDVSRHADGEPNHLVVRATDEALFQCPFVIIEDVGAASFSDDEAERLRQYLLKGGFLWADDSWGDKAWQFWVAELARILPEEQYAIHDITVAHPVFRTMFDIKRLPQIPSIQYWRRSGGDTSEYGAESLAPQIRGISDSTGHLMVLITHNTDIADAWEREGEDPEFFYRFSPDGYAVGINVIMYAMTH
jgi:hypothetical protein